MEKEKKSSSYKENKLEVLSDEKVSKIKRFSREYITKLVRKLLEKAGSSRKAGSKPSTSRRGHHATHTPSTTSAATPSSAHEDARLDVVEMEMSVEEVVDVDEDTDDDDDGGGDDDHHHHQNNDITKFQPFLNYTCSYA